MIQPDSQKGSYQIPQGEQSEQRIAPGRGFAEGLRDDARRDIEQALAISANTPAAMRLERSEPFAPEIVFVRDQMRRIRTLREVGVTKGRWNG